MISIVKTMVLQGLKGTVINVEVDVSRGIPLWSVVGLPDASIKESKDRIKTAIKNSGFELPSMKYIINLSPADIRKEGTGLDLAIAVSILSEIGKIKRFDYERIMLLGELSLDGNIKKINGILPICLEAKMKGIKRIIIPFDNVKEASVVDGVEIIGVKKLIEVVYYLNGDLNIEPAKVNIATIDRNSSSFDLDFSEVKGQESIKRALEVAASGGHSTLLIGSPGSGKTLLSRRIPTILPDLSFKESLEITKIHSVAGLVSRRKYYKQKTF